MVNMSQSQFFSCLRLPIYALGCVLSSLNSNDISFSVFRRALSCCTDHIAYAQCSKRY